ncbi:hypothetical protein KCU85_g386, partial [Aureobasidium melanogenum]
LPPSSSTAIAPSSYPATAMAASTSSSTSHSESSPNDVSKVSLATRKEMTRTLQSNHSAMTTDAQSQATANTVYASTVTTSRHAKKATKSTDVKTDVVTRPTSTSRARVLERSSVASAATCLFITLFSAHNHSRSKSVSLHELLSIEATLDTRPNHLPVPLRFFVKALQAKNRMATWINRAIGLRAINILRKRFLISIGQICISRASGCRFGWSSRRVQRDLIRLRRTGYGEYFIIRSCCQGSSSSRSGPASGSRMSLMGSDARPMRKFDHSVDVVLVQIYQMRSHQGKGRVLAVGRRGVVLTNSGYCAARMESTASDGRAAPNRRGAMIGDEEHSRMAEDSFPNEVCRQMEAGFLNHSWTENPDPSDGRDHISVATAVSRLLVCSPLPVTACKCFCFHWSSEDFISTISNNTMIPFRYDKNTGRRLGKMTEGKKV